MPWQSSNAPASSTRLSTGPRRREFVNAAESDFVAVVDPIAGEVTGRVETGAYP